MEVKKSISKGIKALIITFLVTLILVDFPGLKLTVNAETPKYTGYIYACNSKGFYIIKSINPNPYESVGYEILANYTAFQWYGNVSLYQMVKYDVMEVAVGATAAGIEKITEEEWKKMGCAEADYIKPIDSRISVSGTTKVGETVRFNSNGLNDSDVFKGWYSTSSRDYQSYNVSSTATLVSTERNYTIKESDVGKYLFAKVETTNKKNFTEISVVGFNSTVSVAKYNVNVSARDTNGAVVDAKLTGLGEYFYNTEVKVMTQAVPGYNFVGWYQASAEAPGYTGNILCKNHMYTFKINENTNLVAVYKPLETVSITVDGGSSYTINGSEYTAPNTSNYSLGTNVTVAVSDEKDFDYWANEQGMILSRKSAYTFSVTGPMKLTAVYNKKVENKSTVIFESYYGQVMSRSQIGSGETVNLPAGPTRYGYNFIGWSMTVEEIKKQITDGISVIKVMPVYELIKESYTITVKDGTGSGNYNLNNLVTATANDPESGKKFSHWTDADGNILSYSTTYQFYTIKAVEITAKYVADTTVVEAKGTAKIINIDKKTKESKIVFVSMVTVPEGCKIQMAGVIGTDNETVGTSGDGFNKDTAVYVRGGAWSSNACRYTWTKKVTAEETWYVRAYLVYKDTNGNLITVYGDMISAGLNN